MDESPARLPVAGAGLRFRTKGGGPHLLLIHGSGGSWDSFREIHDALTARYNVISYDRRGCGDSLLDAASSDAPTLQDHVDDARALLDRLGVTSTDVLACSAGGPVALRLAACDPRVRAVLVHEATAFSLVPEARFADEVAAIRSLERTGGLEAAIARFTRAVGVLGAAPDSLIEALAKASAARRPSPLHELELTLDPPPIEALRRASARVVVAAGQAEPTSLPYRASEALARALGVPLAKLPGNHFGMATFPPFNDPPAFAARVLELLAACAT